MNNLLTKKNVFLMGLSGTVLFLSPVIFDKIYDCYQNSIFFCSHSYQVFTTPFVVFIPFFIFSLITYSLREEVFRSWISFARWWVPLSAVFAIITPRQIPGSFSVPAKGPVVLFFSLLFVIVSIIIIYWKHSSLRKK